MRFGLYACGWDLVTSPAGIVQGLVARGPKGALVPFGAATRAARRAMQTYMVNNRKFDFRTRRRSTIIAWSVLSLAMIMLVIASLVFVISVELAAG